MKVLAYLFAVLVLSLGPAFAADRASPDEAKAMATAAAAFVKAEGKDNAFKSFNSADGRWHDRDLYVFVVANDGQMLAHGAKAAMIGRNFTDLRDVDGKAFIQAMVAVKDQDWVEYKWHNPVSNTVEAKTSYIIRPDQDFIVGVGAYK